MRPLWRSLFLLLALAWPASGQVTIELVQDETQVLMGEPIPVAVKIVNRSGQTLRLGDRGDWLTFNIEDRDRNRPVARLSDVPVLGEFELGTSKVATKTVEDLGPHFEFVGNGRFAVTATLRIPEWGIELTSEASVFYINRGTRIWDREIGLPSPSGGPPVVRRYTLQQAYNASRQLRLFLRVADVAEYKMIRLAVLGPMVSFSRPEPQVDKENRLHVLFQTGARAFYYCVCNPNGEVLNRQVYEYSGTRPQLKLDLDGEVQVVGGALRPEPAAADSTAVSNAPAIKPIPAPPAPAPATNTPPAPKAGAKK